ncbi:hypothetical protein [Desulfuribacillus alkaliarsenatis]|uniref:hypothetical protein n=1 Tax=Desulfuribacillus alkaliarsenatis TaxID=766136 RepID=UPI00159F1F7B|nr:hypothetical protein [Desulfuribacillus alkaliarsenatis]
MKVIDPQELKQILHEIELELKEKAVEYDISRETEIGKKFIAGQIIGLNCALHKLKRLL